MTHPIYESTQLTAKSLAQLKEIAEVIACTEVTDKRRKESWITAILNHQSSQIKKVEPKTCATCPLFKPFADGSGRGLCCGSDQVSRDHHPQTGDCSHLIQEATNNLTVNLPEGQEAASNLTANLPEGYQQPKLVQSSLLTYKPTDCGVGTYEVWRGTDEKYGTIAMMVDGRWTHSVAPIAYGTPYEAAAGLIEATEAMQSFSEDIEVDSNYDLDFGLLYRVWKGWELLGTFYHALDGQWVAQPCKSDVRPRCNTAYIAQLSILALAGVLVVRETEDELAAVA